MTSITITASDEPHYTTEALDRAAMLIEDVLRGREPLRIDGLSANTGKPVSMIRAAVARGIAAGELAIVSGGHIVPVRCKPAAEPAKAPKSTKPRKVQK